MLDHIKPENLLFLDIETVPQEENYYSIRAEIRKLWDKKAKLLARDNETPEELYGKAGIFAEFGKIVCISVGLITGSDNDSIRLKSFYGDDERKLLKDFGAMLKNYSSKKDFSLCAHNGKEFDFPFIARRMLIKGVQLPEVVDLAGKKPWEVQLVDTMELWKFGDFKSYTSLELLAAIFDIPTPKDDIDGSMVAEVYYKEKDLERIVKYCEKDVITIINLLLKLKGKNIIPSEKVEIV